MARPFACPLVAHPRPQGGVIVRPLPCPLTSRQGVRTLWVSWGDLREVMDEDTDPLLAIPRSIVNPYWTMAQFELALAGE